MSVTVFIVYNKGWKSVNNLFKMFSIFKLPKFQNFFYWKIFINYIFFKETRIEQILQMQMKVPSNEESQLSKS